MCCWPSNDTPMINLLLSSTEIPSTMISDNCDCDNNDNSKTDVKNNNYMIVWTVNTIYKSFTGTVAYRE